MAKEKTTKVKVGGKTMRLTDAQMGVGETLSAVRNGQVDIVNSERISGTNHDPNASRSDRRKAGRTK